MDELLTLAIVFGSIIILEIIARMLGERERENRK